MISVSTLLEIQRPLIGMPGTGKSTFIVSTLLEIQRDSAVACVIAKKLADVFQPFLRFNIGYEAFMTEGQPSARVSTLLEIQR